MKTTYSQISEARGALLIVFIGVGNIIFSKSALVALDSASSRHVLPFRLPRGQHKAFMYDMERDGTLFNGVGYPAVKYEFQTSGNNLGIRTYSNYTLHS